MFLCAGADGYEEGDKEHRVGTGALEWPNVETPFLGEDDQQAVVALLERPRENSLSANILLACRGFDSVVVFLFRGSD